MDQGCVRFISDRMGQAISEADIKKAIAFSQAYYGSFWQAERQHTYDLQMLTGLKMPEAILEDQEPYGDPEDQLKFVVNRMDGSVKPEVLEEVIKLENEYQSVKGRNLNSSNSYSHEIGLTGVELWQSGKSV